MWNQTIISIFFSCSKIARIKKKIKKKLEILEIIILNEWDTHLHAIQYNEDR